MAAFSDAVSLWHQKRFVEAESAIRKVRKRSAGLLSWRARIRLDLKKDKLALRDINALLSEPFFSQVDKSGSPSALHELLCVLESNQRSTLVSNLSTLAQKDALKPDEKGHMSLLYLFPLAQWPLAFLGECAELGRGIDNLERWEAELERRLREDPGNEEVERARSKIQARLSCAKNEMSQPQNVHPFYRAALEMIPEPERPGLSPHAFGPAPVLRDGDIAYMATWLEVLAQPKRMMMSEEARRSFTDRFRPKVGEAYLNTVLRRIELLMELALGESVQHARDLLGLLDQEMLKFELQNTTGLPQFLNIRDARILFRGGIQSIGTEVWLLGFPDRVELLRSNQGQILKEEGSLQEMLASVPDVWFDQAVRATQRIPELA